MCVVHMVRHSVNYVSWKMRKAVATDLRSVYAATTLEAARAALDEFEQQWGSDYPPIVQSWWRLASYAENAIEGLEVQDN
jgi:putative transposase